MRMMSLAMTEFRRSGKACLAAVSLLLLSACSVNPATGEQQFTALMPAGQEASIGAGEHPKIIKQYGGPFQIPSVEAYVNMVGQKVAANTERGDVTYKFFVLDTPAVNAFAIPGGYIYVTRGLLGLANSEAELAGVLAHEIGHITARHSAERYSQGILASLGMAVLSAAVNEPGVSRAAGLGSELMLKSYSRSQEYQADELGIRYLSRAGYDPFAVSDFLSHLDAHTKLEQALAQKNGSNVPSYFATHPQTDDRVARAAELAKGYPPSDVTESALYLRKIDGIAWGDSARMGFVRGQTFIHPDMGFTLTFPKRFNIENQADKILAVSSNGAGVIFDGAANSGRLSPPDYLRKWVAGKDIQALEPITVNGMNGATAMMPGKINGQPAVIRLVAVEWTPTQVFRFQIAMPQGTAGLEDDLRRMVHTLRTITPAEREKTAALRIGLVTATGADTADTLARAMNLQDTRDNPANRFRVLNGLTPKQAITPGRIYKVIR